jgi:hypothetical protein
MEPQQMSFKAHGQAKKGQEINGLAIAAPNLQKVRSISMKSTRIAALIIALLTCASGAVFAEEQKQDDTGTNPVNFTYDFRFYTELQQFPDDAGSQIKNTVEFRVPLGRDIANMQGTGPDSQFYDMGESASLRFRASYANLSLNDPTGTSAATTEVAGISDMDFRLLGVAYANKNIILAPGLEVFLDTSSNEALGSGENALGPVLFAVFPGLVGPASLFAPGYQYVFDIGGGDNGADISRSQIDLYFVWLLAKGKNWLLIDPQIIVDHENSREFATVDLEWGFMIAPKQGISGYLRPGFGVGADRPFDYNLEFAIKFIWR